MESPTHGRLYRAAHHPLLLGLYLPSILLYIAAGMLLPLMPLYVAQFEVSYGVIGLVLAGEALGSLFGDLPAGALFRRIGQRRTMLLGVALVMLANLALFWAPSILIVFFCRFLSGVAHALYGLSQHAILTHSFASGRRGRATALFGGVFRIGSLIGPVLSGAIALTAGLRAPFLVTTLLFSLSLALLLVYLRDDETRPAVRVPGHTTRGALADVLRQHGRTLATAGTGQFLGMVIRNGRNVFIPLFAADVLRLDVGMIGLIVSITSALELMMVLPAGWVMDKWGRKFAMVPCFVLQGIGLMMVPFTVGPLGLLLASALMGFSNGLGSGTMLALGSDLAPPEQRGEFLSLWRLVGDSGLLGAPLLVGTVADLLVLSASAWAVGAAGIGAGLIFAFLVPETLPNARQLPRFPPAALPVRLKRKG